MVKSFFKYIGLAFMTLMLVQAIAFAQEGASEGGNTSTQQPKNVEEAGFSSRCDDAEAMGFPPCADSPSKCGSKSDTSTQQVSVEGGSEEGVLGYGTVNRTPFNCIFLQEPIGGKPGYDLYRISPPSEGTTGHVYSGNEYTLWHGEAIIPPETGPVQAILAYEKGKETQGPFGLLYNYLGLVYNFLSGIIVGFVVLVAIIGGIRMTVSHGDETAYSAGKKMIIKALVGMVLWFTASVILYTINPTFFAF